MRRFVTLIALGVVLASPVLARADEPVASEAGPPEWHAFVLRAHAGLGVFLNGGAVGTTIVPNLFEHARFSGQLGLEVGARPFGGGFIISLVGAAQAADGAVVGTGGLSLEYDLLYLFGMRDPNQDFALALGGALTMDYAHSVTTSAAGVVFQYDLLRPDWRAYLELRIRNSAQEHWLIRAQIVTGFDDFLDLASMTLCAGYMYDAY